VSHHLDSPASRQDPRLNVTDLYVFAGQTGTVLVMNVNSSAAGGPPGFHPGARYEFKVHVDGDAYETITYRLTFGAADGDGSQPVRVVQIAGVDARDDAAAGTTVAEGRTGAVVQGGGGEQTGHRHPRLAADQSSRDTDDVAVAASHRRLR
jgi:hypothetical protein